MTCITNAQTNGPCPNWTFSASTNRITNAFFTYDAAGNLTKDGNGPGTHTYQWDAENRLKSVDTGSTASYTYNALGQRVEKLVGTAYTEVAYDASGEPVGENNRTSWTQSYVPFAGRHVAHYQNGVTYFTHGNSLGSTAQATDYTGAVSQDQLFYPWGQSWTMAGTTQETRFASLRHRDSETGADPTLYRMFSSTQGRWFSPDPVPGTTSDPQTFDLYSYVTNNPTNRIDPKGNCWGVTVLVDGFYWDLGGYLIYARAGPYGGGGYCDPYFGCGFGFFGGGAGSGCDWFQKIGCTLCKANCSLRRTVGLINCTALRADRGEFVDYSVLIAAFTMASIEGEMLEAAIPWSFSACCAAIFRSSSSVSARISFGQFNPRSRHRNTFAMAVSFHPTNEARHSSIKAAR